MSRDNLEGLLRGLATSAGFPDLGLDADGRCLVRIDGRIDLAIEFDDDSQSLVLTARCGPLPQSNREHVLQALLDANFYGAGSGGATLSTNSREGAVYMQFREPTLHLDQPRLQDLLQAAVVNAEFWGARLQKLAAGPAAHAPAHAPHHNFTRA